jgi:tetratricopeptide (TPR) repeat protein
MNLRYIIAVLLAFAWFISASEAIDYYSAENTRLFAEYLYQERDYTRSAKEYERYLLISQQKDDALYNIGLCYRHAGDTQKAVDFFQRLTKEYPQSDLKFSASYQIGYSYLLSGRYKESINHIEQTLNGVENKNERQKLEILLALNYLNQRQWRSADKLLNSTPPYSKINFSPLIFPLVKGGRGDLKSGEPEDKAIERIMLELRDRSREGISLKRKSRLLSSLMSAILPGSGKMYCKQYGNGIFSFIITGTTGLLAFDGFHENGVRSVRGWIFGSLFTVFYAGNIYGSGISSLAYNRQAETDILMRLPSPPDDW